MTETNGLTLRMSRTLRVPRPKVWTAMVDPNQLTSWWGPRGFTVPELDFDPQTGQSYRIAMQPPEGEVFHLFGEFQDVEAPSRLTYTFAWDPPDDDDRNTQVVLSLEDLGEQTEVNLSQGEFATQARLELHEGGWSDSFDKLEELLG